MTTTAANPDIVITNPADGTVVGTVANTTPDDVRQTVAELRIYQPAWEQLGTAGRAAVLRDLRDWLLDHDSEIADVLQSETGKARAEANLEASVMCDLINYYAGHARKFLAAERVRPGGPLTAVKRLIKVYRPYPVVGIITPWNFPLAMPLMDAIPALLAGAAVVMQAVRGTRCPLSSSNAHGPRSPPRPCCACSPASARPARRSSDAVDYVQFTGSTPTGRIIGARTRQSSSSPTASNSAARTRPSCSPTPTWTAPSTGSHGAAS